MQMRRSDITIIRVDLSANSIYVGASAGTIGMTWPYTVVYGGDLYVYKCNEVLTEDLSRHYGGHAKYIRKEVKQ